jgi:hypothetical protein
VAGAADPCAQLQRTDCYGAPNDLCLPREVIIDANGQIQATLCECFDPTIPDCGPVTIYPTGIECMGNCPPGVICQVFKDGVPTGQTNMYSGEMQPNAVYSCGCPPTVPNDDCETPELLPVGPGGSIMVVGDNTDATEDVTPICTDPGTGEDVGTPYKGMWYAVEGTGNTMKATTCTGGGTLTDTMIQVWCGDCGNLVCAAADDDDPTCYNGLYSTAEWCASPGVAYFIIVGGYGNYTGTFELEVSDDGIGCSGGAQCVAPIGRCCRYATPDCLDVAQNTCTLYGGYSWDQTKNCTDNPCPIPNWGACCKTDGTCVHLTQPQCASISGTYKGDGVYCDSNPCP